jgi:excinuclease ABC subunit C
MPTLEQKLQILPQRPGVYLFKNASGEVLYVGKAKNLKNRIRSYFVKNADHAARTVLLISLIKDLNYIIVSSETESLMLENNLIKQYQPRFNVRLRDDKNYQFIKIDYDFEIPQIYTARRIEKGGQARYFGPYTSGSSVKQTLKLMKRIFQICSNKTVSSKPCFYYHLGRCPGVCIGKISLEAYRRTLREIEQFLNHRRAEVLKTLKQQMQQAAQKKQFEKAAGFRDKIRSLISIWERQKIIFTKRFNSDYFSLFSGSNNETIVNLFMIREGKLINQESFEVLDTQDATPGVILESFLKQYYLDASDVPREIVIRYPLPGKTELERWLKTRILIPRRGKKIQLLALGEENAKDYYQKTFASFESVLIDLQKFLHLPGLPKRIEAYDISNIQGFLPAGSMIVFENGQAKKSEYRKFKIRREGGPNDFAMIQEILERRFAHLETPKKTWPRPDLIIIDGGKGQLNAALQVQRRKNSNIPIIGLAKRLEEIFLPGLKQSLLLAPNSRTLFLLQRIRDEAHRFAITFYRGRHQREQTRSRLDDIPGVGSVTRKKLLKKFGSPAAIRKSSLEALAKEIGMKMAQKIKENL